MPIRDRFPIFQHKTYINSCSYGALSTDVRQAYEQYLADWESMGSPWDYWVGLYESARASFAGLINAAPDEVAVVPFVSAAVNSVASALDFSGPRNTVLVSEFEFPTVGQIWHAQERRGAQVRHVPDSGCTIPLEHFDELIDQRTLLVSITHVCYRNGARLDVPAIVELAHSRGALVLLDSYQALGTFPVDVKALDVDFLVGGTHKYLLSSAGTAFLYVRPELIEQLIPTTSGWFAQANIGAMDIHSNEPSPSARRFEMGTPVVPSVYTALAGFRLIESVGIDAITAEIADLTRAIKSGVRELGLQLATPDEDGAHGAMIAIRARDEQGIVAALEQDNIVASYRGGNLRLSPHFYNNLQDIDIVLEAMQRHRQFLQ